MPATLTSIVQHQNYKSHHGGGTLPASCFPSHPSVTCLNSSSTCLLVCYKCCNSSFVSMFASCGFLCWIASSWWKFACINPPFDPPLSASWHCLSPSLLHLDELHPSVWHPSISGATGLESSIWITWRNDDDEEGRCAAGALQEDADWGFRPLAFGFVAQAQLVWFSLRCSSPLPVSHIT